ncbi:MAG TPA: tetratricopeptide repeat protein [Acidimicrobiales bacterium]|nr:tetratricopeptide repeat protein [Acidimicrobiales bacterium]
MVEVTDASFERDVLERSAEVPVVVDLWAEWCGPCRTLGPILERVVADTDGAVELTKVDVDQNPRIAATFRVQSIPAVFALRDRQVVDSFIGAQPEAVVKEFVDRLAPAATETDLLVEQGDESSLRRALELQPDHPGAVVALAEMLVGRGEADEALALLGRVPETAEVRRVAALARLGDGASLDGDDSLEGRLDGLLDRVKHDEEARREFLDLLEAMGPGDPRTVSYRKALTARLF